MQYSVKEKNGEFQIVSKESGNYENSIANGWSEIYFSHSIRDCERYVKNCLECTLKMI